MRSTVITAQPRESGRTWNYPYMYMYVLAQLNFIFFFKHTKITKIVSQVQINPLNDSSFMQPYEEWIALIKPNEIFVKLLYSNN